MVLLSATSCRSASGSANFPEMLLVVCGALLLGYLVKCLAQRLSSKLPPGPWGLPLLGYAPFLSSSAHLEFFELHKKFGSIFGFYNGSRYTVVLGDYDSIKEAYNKEEFIDRQPGAFVISDDYDHVGQMNGWQWKETRRFTLTTLRNLGMGRNKVEERIKELISLVMATLEKLPPGTEVDTHKYFYPTLVNMMFNLICGKKFEDEDAAITMIDRYTQDWKYTREYSETLFKDLENYSHEFFYPILRPIFAIANIFQTKKRAESLQIMEDFMWNEIESHKKIYDENNQEDYYDYYITEMKKRTNQETSFTFPNMNGNSQILMLAGTDTTRTSLDWLFLILAQFPKEQERVHEEVVELLGKEKEPSWSDKESLPYTSAYLMEAARFKTIAPASDPHWSNRSGTIGGFYIPESTILLANIHAVHFDPKLWGDPQCFRPERFLSSDGSKIVQPEYWMPFLIGKRSCPGEKLANMELFLILTTVVQKFKISPPKSGLSLEETTAVLVYPVKPTVSFERRT